MPHQTSPLVSVVIPCYNHAHFLVEAIDSVMKQTYRSFEIIIVDDGSTDDTSKIASGYTDPRLIHQDNLGLSAARNAGLEASRGSYVVFLDADDRLLPNALEAGVNALDAHPDCSFVFGRCRVIAKDGSPVASGPQPRIESRHYLELLRDNYIWNPAQVMYRREIFKTFGAFDTTVSAAADYDLYLRITRNSPIHNHYAVISEYRQHGENMSCNSKLMLKTTLAVLRSQWPHVEGKKEYEKAYREGIIHWREFYGDRLVNEVRLHVRSRRWTRALLDTLVLAKYFPRGVMMHARRKSRSTIGKIKNQSNFLSR